MGDSVRMCVVFAPLAAYLFYVAALNLGRRPKVVSGVWDTTALGVGLAGFGLVGPLELLAPDRAFHAYGQASAWAMLGMMYTLIVVLINLTTAPSLVVYNLRADDVRTVLGRTLEILQADSRWAGNTFVLPQHGVEATVDVFTAADNLKLVGTSAFQSADGWRTLHTALHAAVAECSSRPNAFGVAAFVCGAVSLAVAVWSANGGVVPMP